MTNPAIGDLFDRQIIHENPLATVMSDCIVLRHADRQSHTVIALSDVAGIKRIRTTHPVLLVFSSSLSLISAAAFSSKEGSNAAWPVALLAAAFAAGYLLSRKSSVAFLSSSSSVETVSGSLAEAAELIAAVQAVQARERQP